MKAQVSMILLLVLVAMASDVVHAGSPRLSTVQEAFGVSSALTDHPSKCHQCADCVLCHVCISKLGERVKCVHCCDYEPSEICKVECAFGPPNN